MNYYSFTNIQTKYNTLQNNRRPHEHIYEQISDIKTHILNLVFFTYQNDYMKIRLMDSISRIQEW